MNIIKIFSIIITTLLCLGTINAQTISANSSLPVVQTGNNEYEAVNIQSTQVINSEATTDTTNNGIALKPGFHDKTESNFAATIDDTVTIMTYNVHKRNYRLHAEVIKASGADVVAIQEVAGGRKYNILKKETGFKGSMCTTFNIINIYKYGIVLLWNEAKLGKPISVKNHKINTPKDKDDPARAYIVAEFNDFCIIATHLSTDTDENKKMANAVLNEEAIKNYRKPVFIAGDLNPRPEGGIPRPSDGYETVTALQAKGFEMLSYTDKSDPEYHEKNHATRINGTGQPDLILGYNKNPNRKIIWSGVPAGADRTFKISDHLPYVVKVKL